MLHEAASRNLKLENMEAVRQWLLDSKRILDRKIARFGIDCVLLAKTQGHEYTDFKIKFTK